MREQLERLIDEMVSRGIRYPEAQREFERRFIIKVLNTSNGSLSRASEVLGIHRNTLSRKIAEHRIKRHV